MIMGAAGVPLVPGYHGHEQDIDHMKSEAEKIGYPLIIKPTHGGGGKKDFADSFLGAQREAAASFGVNTILLEKYITRPRHIEVQVFGDKHGNVIHLYERDFSVQRRHQKIIEEAPAFRDSLGQATVSAAKAIFHFNFHNHFIDVCSPEQIHQKKVFKRKEKEEFEERSKMIEEAGMDKEEESPMEDAEEEDLEMNHGCRMLELSRKDWSSAMSDSSTSLMLTLEITDTDEFLPIKTVCDFATLVGTYARDFSIIIEPYDERMPHVPDPILQLSCHDSSLAIKPVFDRFQSVVITSGTLSPIDLYPRLLSFNPVVSRSVKMSMTRDCICPMVLTQGSDQLPISTKFDMRTLRSDPGVVRNYGKLLVEMVSVVPDGVVCFFVSYSYMDDIIATWIETGILMYTLSKFSRHDKQSKLPGWILSHRRDAHLNLSTDMAIHMAREFLRKLAQPYDKAGTLGRKTLLT
ncbi:hypothetical protein Bca4012_008477 [Brassica carinata]